MIGRIVVMVFLAAVWYQPNLVAQNIIEQGDNVGIGTANPSGRLHIVGSADEAGTVRLEPDSKKGPNHSHVHWGPRGDWYIRSASPAGTVVLQDSGGNVAIGANTPVQARLYVSGGNAAAAIRGEHGANGIGVTGSTDSGEGVVGSSRTGNGVRGVSVGVVGVYGESGSGVGVFGRSSGANGFGGVFTNSAPGGIALNVQGRMRTGVIEITGGADLAEHFDIDSLGSTGVTTGPAITAGMVVSIDPANPGKLALSTLPYDRRVVGIISGAGGVNPGMTMNEAVAIGAKSYPVALTGRVYCWVDATFNAIEPGDLLTTSATPGYAMKANDLHKAQGAIIGKAMTGLDGGKGLVLVVVTLQ